VNAFKMNYFHGAESLLRG